MRKGYNTNDTFIDAGLLRDHVSKLRSEKKMATRLRESIRAMQQCRGEYADSKYYSALHDVDMLIEYLERMARLLAEAEERAIQISRETNVIITDRTDETRNVSSHSFML